MLVKSTTVSKCKRDLYEEGEILCIAASYLVSLTDLIGVPTVTIVQARLNSGYYTTVGSFSSFGYQQSVVACRNQYVSDAAQGVRVCLVRSTDRTR